MLGKEKNALWFEGRVLSCFFLEARPNLFHLKRPKKAARLDHAREDPEKHETERRLFFLSFLLWGGFSLSLPLSFSRSLLPLLMPVERARGKQKDRQDRRTGKDGKMQAVRMKRKRGGFC